VRNTSHWIVVCRSLQIHSEELEEQMQECTFSPKINKAARMPSPRTADTLERAASGAAAPDAAALEVPIAKLGGPDNAVAASDALTRSDRGGHSRQLWACHRLYLAALESQQRQRQAVQQSIERETMEFEAARERSTALSKALYKAAVRATWDARGAAACAHHAPWHALRPPQSLFQQFKLPLNLLSAGVCGVSVCLFVHSCVRPPVWP
jgi:hypothetical protein